MTDHLSVALAVFHGEPLGFDYDFEFANRIAPAPFAVSVVPKVPAPVGPPSAYSDVLAEKICDRLADGHSLRAICSDPAMPSKATVFRWIAKHPEFETQYRWARQALIDGMAEEIIEIADDKSQDWELPAGGEGGEAEAVLNKTAIARSKLMIETRKWVMAKEMPRKYGEPLPALLEPARDGSDAKPVAGTVIENDPLHDAFNAWAADMKR